MGLFGKLKNILFEDDDEVEEMPVYTTEEVKEEPEEIKIEPTVTEEVEMAEVKPTRFKNVKRDIDIDFADEDVIGEVPGAFEEQQIPEIVAEEPEVAPAPKPVEEKKSVFLDFDEDEFERLNARINHNESKATQREVVRRVDLPVNNGTTNVARQANNNFSSTTVSEEQRDPDKFKINSGTIVSGKKPFTPSPVISPVYGILGKNFTKDDIVDRKGGLKRERVNKPIPKKEEIPEEVEEEVVVNIDSIRKKAYGEDIELPEEKKVEEVKVEKKEEVKNTKPSEEVYKEVEDIVDETPIVPEPEVKEPTVEEQIENETYDTYAPVDEELDSVIDEVVPEAKAEKVEKKKMRVLDDLEKTSTLKILDDIEKELNSIKPISKEKDEEEEVIAKEHEKTMDDTLENDLFNLIDSMYEEGDEDDD